MGFLLLVDSDVEFVQAVVAAEIAIVLMLVEQVAVADVLPYYYHLYQDL